MVFWDVRTIVAHIYLFNRNHHDLRICLLWCIVCIYIRWYSRHVHRLLFSCFLSWLNAILWGMLRWPWAWSPSVFILRCEMWLRLLSHNKRTCLITAYLSFGVSQRKPRILRRLDELAIQAWNGCPWCGWRDVCTFLGFIEPLSAMEVRNCWSGVILSPVWSLSDYCCTRYAGRYHHEAPRGGRGYWAIMSVVVQLNIRFK